MAKSTRCCVTPRRPHRTPREPAGIRR
jgi:hypothetical protein